MTYREALRWITQSLATDDAEQNAYHLLSWAVHKSPLECIIQHNEELLADQLSTLRRALDDHLNHHKPLQYILGTVPFLSTTITVCPPILIPRPETEEWVAYLISELTPYAPRLLLDLCTGTGCIAIALAQAFPSATVYAIDITPEAINLAQENIRTSGCTNIRLIQSDLYKELDPTLQFDCIVSNPPYLRTSEWNELETLIKEWEDPRALISGADGLSCLRTIIEGAATRLTRRSSMPQIALEIGSLQGAEVAQLLIDAGFKALVRKDLSDHDRLVLGEKL